MSVQVYEGSGVDRSKDPIQDTQPWTMWEGQDDIVGKISRRKVLKYVPNGSFERPKPEWTAKIKFLYLTDHHGRHYRWLINQLEWRLEDTRIIEL